MGHARLGIVCGVSSASGPPGLATRKTAAGVASQYAVRGHAQRSRSVMPGPGSEPHSGEIPRRTQRAADMVDSMMVGRGFMQQPQSSKAGSSSDRPISTLAAVAILLLAGAINLVVFISGVVSLLAGGFEGSTTAILLFALSSAAVFLVALPAITGWFAFRGSTMSVPLAVFYFVAQLLGAFQSMNALQYILAGVSLVGLILLLVPTSRQYIRHRASSQ